MLQTKRIVLVFLLLTGLFCSKARADEGKDPAILFYTEQLSADSILAHIQALEGFGTRFCLADNRKDIAKFLHDRFLSMGLQEVFLDSFLMEYPYMGTDYRLWQYNVVARIPGYLPTDSVYILGAHYDAIVPFDQDPFSVAPGANDNASGVAAVLEVARVFAAHGYKPAHTLEFVLFAAEELGLKGSWYHADEAVRQNRRIAAMINNDMICYATQAADTWTVQIHHYDNARWLTDLARKIIDNYTILDVVETQRYIRNSDSWPFYGKAYHAIFFHQHEITPYYHTTDDSSEHTNPLYAAEMTKISAGMLVHLNGTGTITSLPEGGTPDTPGGIPGLQVYAVRGELYIHVEQGTGPKQLQVFDLTGRCLIRHVVQAGEHTRVLTGLPPGIYLVRAASHGQLITQKIFCY